MMILSKLKIILPDDLTAMVQAEVQSGRYDTPDEFFVHAIYLLVQELDRKGFSVPASKAVLARSLEDTLAEFRQAIAKQNLVDRQPF